MCVLPPTYFQQENVVALARELIGCRLNTVIDGKHCSAVVVETEAYAGISDKASHAYMGRKTNRTSVMYQNGGVAYVYFCYGMHYLFNVVTAGENVPHAILIRALLPINGIETMQQRRGLNIGFAQLANGPGKLTRAMGIGMEHNGILLEEGRIWFEKTNEMLSGSIEITPRIGIDYAGEDALLPYRFVWVPTNNQSKRSRKK